MNLGSKILKPSAYPYEKSKRDSSMLIKGNEIKAQTIKRLPEVNDTGIKLDYLKIKSMLAPNSQISY